jgi:hypothetical protein
VLDGAWDAFGLFGKRRESMEWCNRRESMEWCNRRESMGQLCAEWDAFA